VVGLKVNEASGRIQKFKLEYKDEGVWKTALSGTTLGEKYEKSFLRATSKVWRLNILEATEGPTMLIRLTHLPPTGSGFPLKPVMFPSARV